MIEADFQNSSWDKRKVLIGVVTIVSLLFVAVVAKAYFLDSKQQASSSKNTGIVKDVQGVKSVNEEILKDEELTPTPIVISEIVQKKLDVIKKQIANLTPEDVASSSPQVQKVLQDIKTLEQYPKNQAQEICQNICSSIK